MFGTDGIPDLPVPVLRRDRLQLRPALQPDGGGDSGGVLRHSEDDVGEVPSDLALLPAVGSGGRGGSAGEHAALHDQQLLAGAVLVRSFLLYGIKHSHGPCCPCRNMLWLVQARVAQLLQQVAGEVHVQASGREGLAAPVRLADILLRGLMVGFFSIILESEIVN